MSNTENELHIKITTSNRKSPHGLVSEHRIEVYPDAIKDAVMEYLLKYNYIKRSSSIKNYYIELDRTENLMVAVIDC